LQFYFLGSNFLASNVPGSNLSEVTMLWSLISALKCRARRLRPRLALSYRVEPMPRLRWYK